MIALVPFLACLTGHVFYLAPTGNDASDGLSQGHAWRTLARVQAQPLVPGDQIVLTGGGVFEGSLEFGPGRGGSETNPVVVRSEGTAATILSTVKPAITIRTGGVEVRNLLLRGGAEKQRDGLNGITLHAPGTPGLRHIRIDHVEILGFADNGISMEGAAKNPHGFEDVEISRSVIHDNFGAGIITSDDVAFATGRYAHRNLHITDCRIGRNRAGHGIVLSGVDGAVVEFTSSLGNHNDKGGLGMWAWCARHVTFRYCIAGNTFSGGGDGGGFDLDGGTTDCVIDHCLSYLNSGCGYMHCDFPQAPPTRRNAIRNSISINDGRKFHKSETLGFGFVTWGSGLDDCIIERNIAWVTLPDARKEENGALFVAYIPVGTTKPDIPHVTGCVFRDNVVEVDATGQALVRNDLRDPGPKSVLFVGNVYRSDLNAPFIQGGKRFDGVAGWQALGQDLKPRESLAPKGLMESAMKGYDSVQPRQLPAFFRRLGR